MRRYWGVLILLVWLGPAALAEPEPQILTLQDALRMGVGFHPSVRRKNEEAQAEEAAVNRVKSDTLPKVALESVYKDGVAGQPNFSFPGIIQTSSLHNWGADGALSWSYDFGKTRFRTRAQRHNVGSARAEEKTQMSWIAMKVVRAYHDVLLAQAIVQLEDKNVEARTTVARYAQIRFTSGTIARVDVGLAQASLAEAKVRQIRARNEVLQAYAVLDNAMGVETIAPYRVEEPLAFSDMLEGSLSEDVKLALERRPEMESAREKVKAGEDGLQAAAAGHRPTVRFLASGGYIALQKPIAPDNYSFGVALTFPLFSGGLIEAETEEARHRLAALNNRAQDQANDVRLETTRARILVSSLLESRPAAAERVKQAVDSERLTTSRYRHGLGTLVELQQAQVAALSAQIDEARLRYDTFTAYYALRYARGDILDYPGGKP